MKHTMILSATPSTATPTTKAPTTMTPTTASPTTRSPTTAPPTTASPTTKAPTTATPTTASPTTRAPTTATPTSASPTTAAPVTAPPTTASPVVYPGTGSLGGDPFTSYGGKKAQFWLPLSGTTPLIACNGMQLRGAVFGTGITGDKQQWFRRFAVYSEDRELLSVQVGGQEHAPIHGSDQVEPDAVDVSVEKHPGSAAASTIGDVSAGSPLCVLNVTATGHTVGTGAGAAGALSYVVSKAKQVETVAVSVRGTEFTLFSSVARKFTGAKAAAFVHVDLKFTKIAPAECSGPLPEIWGVQPMSEETAKMLQPPQP